MQLSFVSLVSCRNEPLGFLHCFPEFLGKLAVPLSAQRTAQHFSFSLSSLGDMPLLGVVELLFFKLICTYVRPCLAATLDPSKLEFSTTLELKSICCSAALDCGFELIQGALVSFVMLLISFAQCACCFSLIAQIKIIALMFLRILQTSHLTNLVHTLIVPLLHWAALMTMLLML